MIGVRPFASLGRFQNDWLNAPHHVSFGHYHDEGRMGFGALRSGTTPRSNPAPGSTRIATWRSSPTCGSVRSPIATTWATRAAPRPAMCRSCMREAGSCTPSTIARRRRPGFGRPARAGADHPPSSAARPACLHRAGCGRGHDQRRARRGARRGGGRGRGRAGDHRRRRSRAGHGRNPVITNRSHFWNRAQSCHVVAR